MRNSRFIRVDHDDCGVYQWKLPKCLNEHAGHKEQCHVVELALNIIFDLSLGRHSAQEAMIALVHMAWRSR